MTSEYNSIAYYRHTEELRNNILDIFKNSNEEVKDYINKHLDFMVHVIPYIYKSLKTYNKDFKDVKNLNNIIIVTALSLSRNIQENKE